jgi:hypothetical protein
LRLHRLAPKHRQQQAQTASSDLVHGRPHRRQRDGECHGQGHVVVIVERDIVGNRDPTVAQRPMAPMAAKSFVAKIASGRGRLERIDSVA